ncbi:MAG TPA: hypothetical protein VE262_12315 [Blastocatellia bacterium]|nr:hypothetical protein [Blastocatellia bacterium]
MLAPNSAEVKTDISIAKGALAPVRAYASAVVDFSAFLKTGEEAGNTVSYADFVKVIEAAGGWADFVALEGTVGAARSDTDLFTAGDQRLLDWVNSLGNFSAELEAQARHIQATWKGPGPGRNNLRQRDDVIGIIVGLKGRLEAGSSDILKSSVELLNSYLSAIGSERDSLSQDDARLTRLINKIQQRLPGSSVSHMFVDYSVLSQLNKLREAIRGLKTDNEQAEMALANLLGKMLNLTTEYDATAADLKKAGDEELGGVLQRMDLDVAIDSWKEMTAYAAQSLG